MECGEHSSYDFPEGYLGEQKIGCENLFTVLNCLLHWAFPGWLKISFGCCSFRSCSNWLVPHWYILLQEAYPVVIA